MAETVGRACFRVTFVCPAFYVPDPEHNLDLGATFLRLAGLVKRNGATAAWRG